MSIIKEQVEGSSQAWMNNVAKVLNDKLECNSRQTSAWDTATIRTNFDNEKELSLEIQYNDTENQHIFVAVMMNFMSQEIENSHQSFHFTIKVNMLQTPPEQFTNYVIKLYKYNTKLMEKHLNGIID